MRRPRCPLVYVNLVGANDELIFDGRSFALNADGDLLAQLPAFEEAVQVVDMDKLQIANHKSQITSHESNIKQQETSNQQPVTCNLHAEEELFHALVLGVRDFARKNGLERAFLGLSGGVDSAVVAVIAAEALGPENVTAVAIPSRYSDPRSTSNAQALASRWWSWSHCTPPPKTSRRGCGPSC